MAKGKGMERNRFLVQFLQFSIEMLLLTIGMKVKI